MDNVPGWGLASICAAYDVERTRTIAAANDYLTKHGFTPELETPR